MRISDWSSDVCSSDLMKFIETGAESPAFAITMRARRAYRERWVSMVQIFAYACGRFAASDSSDAVQIQPDARETALSHCCIMDTRQSSVPTRPMAGLRRRSEEPTSELQSLLRISYAVFCLQKTIPVKPKRNTPIII